MSSTKDTRALHAKYNDVCTEEIARGEVLILRGDRPLGHSEDTEALALRWEAINRHRTTCQALRLDMSKVTPEEIARATVSCEAYWQIERLSQVFEALNLSGDNNEGRRVDLIRRVARAGPRNEDEMHILFIKECGRLLQLRQVELISSCNGQPQAAAQSIAGLGRLIQMDEALTGQIAAMHGKDEAASLELHGHLHIHAPAGPEPKSAAVFEGDWAPSPEPGQAQDTHLKLKELPSDLDLAERDLGHDLL